MLSSLFRNTMATITLGEEGFVVERKSTLWKQTDTVSVEWKEITDVWAIREVGDLGSAMFLRIRAGGSDVTVGDRESGWLELARELPKRVEGCPSLRGWLPRIYRQPRQHAAMPIYTRPSNVIEFPKAAAAGA